MLDILNQFLKDDDGAITVDWVVLTAGVIGVAFGAFAVVTGGTANLSEQISTNMSEKPVEKSF